MRLVDEGVNQYQDRPVWYQDGSPYQPIAPVDVSRHPSLVGNATNGPDILNIASGVNPIPGAINVDLQGFAGAQLTFDFREPWPIEPNTFDKVTFFHCLEHVEPSEALFALQEAFRVLRPAGFTIIEVPDLVKMCQQVADPDGNYGVMMGGIYGGADSPLDHHVYGYTRESLTLLCHLAGFIRYVSMPGKDYHAVQIPSLRVEAVKCNRRPKVKY